ncbi:HHL312Wp [Eremothecium sinecaudum]|uniref:HHL312Wp n=1 Tax=Eremothecium sinecaudum TaxID=45286 RepID=A0A109V0U5_9SACH|nr:HHL312Wp [Eremothecium sinecaudum]AMD22458.1 HHL312Wp [Eremothecium sinecaudum]
MPFGIRAGEFYTRGKVADAKDDITNFSDGEASEHFVTQLDKGSKHLGVISAISLILNRIVGTGIFVVTPDIYRLAGSVGLTLILWVVGAAIALIGAYVYMEFGSAIPRNGGEKNYLEYLFKKPKFFVTSLYAAYVFLIGSAAGNSVFGAQMLLTAGNGELSNRNVRAVAVSILLFFSILNAVSVKTGIFITNTFGVLKILIMAFIAVVGLVALGGGVNNASGKENFHNAFEGSDRITAYGMVSAIYSVIWSFVGYSNINYALGEVKNPVRTLKIAAPVSLILLTVLYLFVNIAYFAVIPKAEIYATKSRIAVNFFGAVFGQKARRISAGIISLSSLGNVCSVVFSQGRIIQQLGREGVLPYSSFFASSKPFNSPTVGLLQHFIFCSIIIVGPPTGDAYNLILNLNSYPMNIVNTAISGGLLWIYWQRYKGRVEWDPPIKAGVVVTTIFFLTSIYLVIAPYVPPSNGNSTYDSLPYWIHCVLAWGVFGIGAIYWFIWTRLLPKRGNYKLVYSEVLGDDGFWRNKIVKEHNEAKFVGHDEADDSSLSFKNIAKVPSVEYVK